MQTSTPQLGQQNSYFVKLTTPLKFAPIGSEVAFTSDWRVQNSSQLVNNVVLDIIEAPGTTPKLNDRFQIYIYCLDNLLHCTQIKIKNGDITYICLFASEISIKRSKSG